MESTGAKPTFHLVIQTKLTAREWEVVHYLSEGKCVKEIATLFDLSVKTVEAHKYNLMKKLGFHTTPDLVQWYLKLQSSLPEEP